MLKTSAYAFALLLLALIFTSIFWKSRHPKVSSPTMSQKIQSFEQHIQPTIGDDFDTNFESSIIQSEKKRSDKEASNDLDEATLESLEKRLSEGTLTGKDRLIICNIHLNRSEYPMALATADALIEENTEPGRAYYLRAFARRGMEEFSEAIHDIEKSIELLDDSELRSHAKESLAIWKVHINTNR